MLKTAIEAARTAGQIIKEMYHRPIKVESKGFRDLVTEADVAAQDSIVSLIRSRFPSHTILAEENLGSLDELGEYTWVIDPLDGTTNYAFRFPIFSVSIGLAHRGEPVMGVVYDPMRDHLFEAEAGNGACLNGQPLRVAQREEAIGTLVAFDWARKPQVRDSLLQIVNHVARQVGTVRAMGSAALGPCYVAAGWLDAYFHARLSAWDVTAAAVIIREAGGQATNFAGEAWTLPSPQVIAASRAFHPKILAMVQVALGDATPEDEAVS